MSPDINIQDYQTKFQGSPQKYGKAAYCDLFYTKSKLCENVLYKDLTGLKQICVYKIDIATFEAIQSLLKDKYQCLLTEKSSIIECLTKELHTLRKINHDLLEKNIYRVKKILTDHENHITKLLNDKQKEIKVVQSQKQIFQNRVLQLQGKLNQNNEILKQVEKQRQRINEKQNNRMNELSQYEDKMKKNQIEQAQKQKQYLHKINQLHQQKLEIQLYFKKIMLQRNQNNKEQIQQIQAYYQKKITQLQNTIINESLTSKQSLNKVLKRHDQIEKQNRVTAKNLKNKIQQLIHQNQQYKEKTILLTQESHFLNENIGKYKIYLQESESTIRKLKELLLQSQQQLQKAKIQLQKGYLQRDSVLQRIRICEQEAKMWQQSYYLNKSRAYHSLEAQ